MPCTKDGFPRLVIPPSITTGDLILIRTQSAGGSCIRCHTHSLWDHVGLIVETGGTDRGLITLECTSEGVVCYHLLDRINDDFVSRYAFRKLTIPKSRKSGFTTRVHEFMTHTHAAPYRAPKSFYAKFVCCMKPTPTLDERQAPLTCATSCWSRCFCCCRGPPRTQMYAVDSTQVGRVEGDDGFVHHPVRGRGSAGTGMGSGASAGSGEVELGSSMDMEVDLGPSSSRDIIAEVDIDMHMDRDVTVIVDPSPRPTPEPPAPALPSLEALSVRRHLVCSSLVAAAYQYLGVLSLDVDAHRYLPLDWSLHPDRPLFAADAGDGFVDADLYVDAGPDAARLVAKYMLPAEADAYELPLCPGAALGPLLVVEKDTLRARARAEAGG